jgi:hypothetical protein
MMAVILPKMADTLAAACSLLLGQTRNTLISWVFLTEPVVARIL